jgi:hypothetical protein
MKTEKELVDWIYDLHLQNNTEHDTFEEAFKAGIECAIEELTELKKLRVTDVSGSVCDSEWHESNIQHFGKCNACGLNVDDF